MSRHKRSELGFGSDSFLDIIANIVGILIILIVVAGLRVSRASVEVAESPKPTKSRPAKPLVVAPRLPVVITPPPHEKTRLLPPRPLPTPPTPPVPLPPKRPEPKLIAKIRNLEAELISLNRSKKDISRTIAQLEKDEQQLTRQSAALQIKLKQLEQVVSQSQQQLAVLKSRLKRENTTLAGLRLQYDEARRRPKKPTVIRHKLTPVSQLVKGKEIHFRIHGGKIAYVPIEPLVELMRKQVLRQKDWLVKFQRHHGQVGPLGGFTMHYIVERQRSSVFNELQNGGYGRISIALTEWKIHPTENLNAETAKQALNEGSAFFQKLRETPYSTTLTFWVYPDSFKEFRTLQTFARREGFKVAARPLPFGIPIAGSPRGTRSAGQ
ncbi:MAG: hypothetical protein Tsb009_24540 [Planctomycetaceae bacterium]